MYNSPCVCNLFSITFDRYHSFQKVCFKKPHCKAISAICRFCLFQIRHLKAKYLASTGSPIFKPEFTYTVLLSSVICCFKSKPAAMLSMAFQLDGMQFIIHYSSLFMQPAYATSTCASIHLSSVYLNVYICICTYMYRNIHMCRHAFIYIYKYIPMCIHDMYIYIWNRCYLDFIRNGFCLRNAYLFHVQSEQRYLAHTV